jgi:hypothetical protein
MNHQISEKEAIFRFTKVFLAQYISTVRTNTLIPDNFDSFQTEAINMLTHYMLQSKLLLI